MNKWRIELANQKIDVPYIFGSTKATLPHKLHTYSAGNKKKINTKYNKYCRLNWTKRSLDWRNDGSPCIDDLYLTVTLIADSYLFIGEKNIHVWNLGWAPS